MRSFSRQSAMGICAIIGGILLASFAIPKWVATPANVPHLVLSPRFWPYTLAGLLVLTGAGMVITGWRSSETFNEDVDEQPGAFLRVALFFAILLAYLWVLPVLGMVWTSMIAFAASAFLLKADRPVLAIICALVVPLALYAFFAHVAGVAIPQGELVRLP